MDNWLRDDYLTNYLNQEYPAYGWVVERESQIVGEYPRIRARAVMWVSAINRSVSCVREFDISSHVFAARGALLQGPAKYVADIVIQHMEDYVLREFGKVPTIEAVAEEVRKERGLTGMEPMIGGGE